jgi:hypothetical protein
METQKGRPVFGTAIFVRGHLRPALSFGVLADFSRFLAYLFRFMTS